MLTGSFYRTWVKSGPDIAVKYADFTTKLDARRAEIVKNG